MKRQREQKVKRKVAPIRANVMTNIMLARQKRRGIGLYGLRPEMKTADVISAPYNLGSTAVLTTLNSVLEGSSFFQRIGRRIHQTSLQIRGFIVPQGNNAAADAEHLARILIIYDRQPNGAIPVLADVILDTSNLGAVSSAITAGINMNRRERFLVLADMQVCLPPIGINGATAASTVLQSVDPNGNAGTNANQGTLNFNRFIKLRNLETQFRGTAGGIADIDTGSIFMLTFSNSANANGSFNLTASFRLKYLDV